MRPIKNAPAPLENGVPKQYSDYQDWRLDLVEAYEQHCVFCNGLLPYGMEVEHFSPQSVGAVNPLTWDNLRLACSPCNLAKTNIVFSATTHYLPNCHNTHLAFQYKIRFHRKLKGYIACIPIPHPSLNSSQQAKAQKTINDLKLDRVEHLTTPNRRMTDVRWLNRYNAYMSANHQRHLWNTLTTKKQIDAFKETLSDLVRSIGFFSLWHSAFVGVPEMLEVIVNTLKNTETNVFPSPNFVPIRRNAPLDI